MQRLLLLVACCCSNTMADNKRKGSPNEVHTPNGDFEGFIEKAYTCKKCGTPATGFFGFHKLWETDWYEKKLIERWVCQTCYEAFLACARDKCHKMLQSPKLTDPSISQVNSPAETLHASTTHKQESPKRPSNATRSSRVRNSQTQALLQAHGSGHQTMRPLRTLHASTTHKQKSPKRPSKPSTPTRSPQRKKVCAPFKRAWPWQRVAKCAQVSTLASYG
jgi:hypothetical protein